MGIDPSRLGGPIIGVASTWTGTMPCNLNLRELADRVA
jgi:dihydroxy-acid dehydratase